MASLGSSLAGAEADPQDKRLVVGYSHWPPFFVTEADGSIRGVNADLIDAALTPLGYSIEFIPLPWTRGLHGLLTGKVDILASATHTQRRAEYAYYSAPYYRERYALYSREPSSELFSGRSLVELLQQGFRLGVYQGTVYDDRVMQLIGDPKYQSQIVIQTDFNRNYRMLARGRIDGFIQETSEFAYHINTLVTASEDASAVVPILFFSAVPQHLMFSKKNSNWQAVQDFNQGLARLIESGQYQRIFARWHASAWQLDVESP